MNNDARVFELSREIYETLYKGRFNMTIEFLDGTNVSGRVVKHTTSNSPFKVSILIVTGENEEKEIDLKNVKSVTKL